MSIATRIFGGRTAFASLLVAVALVGGTATGCSDDADDGDRGDPVGPDVGYDAGADVGSDTGSEPEPDIVDPSDPDADAGEDADVPDWTLDDTGSPSDGGLGDLELAGVAPERGPVAGGTQFVLTGSGFTSETTVFFGSREVATQLIDGRLVGRTPEAAGPGTVTVKAIDSQTGEAALADAFTYTESVRIESITPNRLPTDGGTEVTLQGSGFDDQTRVSFDGETAIDHRAVDSETLRVTAPPNEVGPATVRVTTREESRSADEGVTYFAPVEIDSVTPAAGPTAGGTQATIRGRGFAEGMSVSFGNADATVQSVGAEGTEANVTIPSNAAGLVDVGVQLSDGGADLLADGFYYRTDPDEFHLAAVHPRFGPAGGGEEVRLIGAGLDAAGVSIAFGGTSASVVRSGPGYAVVDLPSHAAGLVDVVASDGSGTSSTLDDGFEYLEAVEITGVSPAEGPAGGGTSVTIEGSGFEGATSVDFGGMSAQFSVDSDTQITATTPTRAPGTVDVSVERDRMSATLEEAFTFHEDLEVFGISPVRGSSAGGTYVEVRGRGFTGDMGVTFGQNAGQDVELLDSQTVSVRTPPHDPETVDVTVRRDQQTAVAPIRFTFFNPGSSSGGVWGGPIEGSVNVTVYSVQSQPIQGAFVMLSTTPETNYKATTNRNGRVTLSGSEVYGTQTVTATAAGFSSTTVQEVDAENVTIMLTPTGSGGGPPATGPPTATFEGELTGLNKAAEPASNELRRGIVLATKSHPWADTPDPGGNHIVDRGNGDYELTTRIGDLAIVAFGGLYDTTTEEFTPLLMGVERYQSAAGGETYQRDIDLDIELNEEMSFKLTDSPQADGGPDINRVIPYYDFGFEGVVNATSMAEGQGSVLDVDGLAALRGELSDVSYMAVGGAYTQNAEGLLPAPQSVSVRRDITRTDQTVAMPELLGVPFISTPAPSTKPHNDIVTLSPNNSHRPDLYYMRVLTSMGGTIWDAFIPGSRTQVRLPEFPDFSHLPERHRPQPYSNGEYILYVVGVDHPTLDYDSFSYGQLSRDQWRAFSQYSQWIKF